ncbi:hypothetical protein AB1Y20_010019 [Prymnesium parvum]|uniref:Uncharacterized protein n=1 Tax=Prymnesium parvum TaxID=97485 RepID=A0AB34K6Y4_PRYPA
MHRSVVLLVLLLEVIAPVTALQQLPAPRRASVLPLPHASPSSRAATTSRRALIAALPVPFLVGPRTAYAAVTGGGFEKEQFVSRGGGPPALGEVPKLTKGEPSDRELQRLALGYKRLKYLLANWEAETTVCIRGCKGKYENCGCTRDPLVVQAYMGYKSMNDPLFRAGDLMLRASSRIESDEDFEVYNTAMERWNNKADSGNVMAYVSRRAPTCSHLCCVRWGEANPGGGQDEIARYLEKSRKEVVESAEILKTIIDCLGIKVD